MNNSTKRPELYGKEAVHRDAEFMAQVNNALMRSNRVGRLVNSFTVDPDRFKCAQVLTLSQRRTRG